MQTVAQVLAVSNENLVTLDDGAFCQNCMVIPKDDDRYCHACADEIASEVCVALAARA